MMLGLHSFTVTVKWLPDLVRVYHDNSTGIDYIFSMKMQEKDIVPMIRETMKIR